MQKKQAIYYLRKAVLDSITPLHFFSPFINEGVLSALSGSLSRFMMPFSLLNWLGSISIGDADTSTGISTVLVALTVILAVVLLDGFHRLSGGAKPLNRLRVRQEGQSDSGFLLGAERREESENPKNKNMSVSIENSPVRPKEWIVGHDTVPPLAIVGWSNLYLPPSWSSYLMLDRDIIIRPPSVTIPNATCQQVWNVWLDFEAHSQWNGFHRQMQVVEKAGGEVGLRMTVDLGLPFMHNTVETATIYYCDDQRYIFIYGLRGDQGPASKRVLWLEQQGNDCIFHSYDKIGGWVAWFSRGLLERRVLTGFTEQHYALRDRVLQLQLLQQPNPSTTMRQPKGDNNPEFLGVCLVTGGAGFLGAHLVRMLSTLQGVTHVHVLDIVEPSSKQWQQSTKNITFHKGSVTDKTFVQDLVQKVVQPETVFHLATQIDCRPTSTCHVINVQGTQILLKACQEQAGVRRFIYTSSMDCGHHYDTCDNVKEHTHPYSAYPTNPYQASKIDAERAVLLAYHTSKMATVSLRPAHIIGHPSEDVLCRYLRDVFVCFGNTLWGLALGSKQAERYGAKESNVYVENCALGHILAATHLIPQANHRDNVGGRAFYLQDFDENIVHLYRALTGMPPPWLCLPFWFLYLLVQTTCFLHEWLHWLFHFNILQHPMIGLHDGALAAGQPATISGDDARAILGYDAVVPSDEVIAHCNTTTSADDSPSFLIDSSMVANAVQWSAQKRRQQYAKLDK